MHARTHAHTLADIRGSFRRQDDGRVNGAVEDEDHREAGERHPRGPRHRRWPAAHSAPAQSAPWLPGGWLGGYSI